MERWKIKNRFETTRLLFVSEGLLVGLTTGTIVSLFRLSIESSLAIWKKIYTLIPGRLWLLATVVAVNILLAWIIGRIVRSQPNIMGSGIPQVEGQLAGDLDMHWRPILWRKWLTGVWAIGSGLFLGREGPSIQLGGAVGQGIAERWNHSATSRRLFIACGAAAGLSAAFNAPMAGTLFVLEEIYHNFSPLVWMTSLAGAIGADFVSSNIFGLVPVLHIGYSAGFPLYLYGHLLLLGLILGIFGYIYQKVLLIMPLIYEKCFGRLPRYFHGVVPLLLVVPIGIFWPQTLGGGNFLILHIDRIPPEWLLLVGLFMLRFIFSMISYGSGLPGGIFLPILTLGAVLGALYGVVMAQLGLLPAIYIMNCVIFAMAAYFAAIGKAPFTAIILITEMVGNLQHLMPLAVTSFVAYLVVDTLGGAPIYQSLLEKLRPKQGADKLSGRSDRLEVPVYSGGGLDDRLVRDIAWPGHALLIAIRRGDREWIPHGDTVIRAGDTLVLVIDRNERGGVRQAIFRMNTSV